MKRRDETITEKLDLALNPNRAKGLALNERVDTRLGNTRIALRVRYVSEGVISNHQGLTSLRH